MSAADLHRRGFLKLSPDTRMHPIRPPWALGEDAFQHACTRCGDCIETCPEKILIREGVNGYPRIDFKRGECTFCSDCVKACPTTALHRTQALAWMIKAHVGDACLAAQQVICTTCAEQCEAGAIHFIPLAGAVSQPQINTHACTGCGACIAPCPTQAIEVY